MGADLYRKHNKGKEVPILGFERSQKAIDSGYFRDAYNDGSILNKFGLSWWVDIGKLQNKDGTITPKNVIKFRALIEKHKTEFEENLQSLSKEDVDYFKEGARLLINYLDNVILDKDAIEASL